MRIRRFGIGFSGESSGLCCGFQPLYLASSPGFLKNVCGKLRKTEVNVCMTNRRSCRRWVGMRVESLDLEGGRSSTTSRDAIELATNVATVHAD